MAHSKTSVGHKKNRAQELDNSSLTMPGLLTGLTVIVVGGGSVAPGWGIGKAVAVAYARAGAKVCVIDINEVAARETAELIENEGGKCRFYGADATDSDRFSEIVLDVATNFGSVDILHNNVGIGKAGDPSLATADDWRRIANSNIVSLHIATQAVLGYMRSQGSGVILTTSSIAGLRDIGFSHLPYGVTKAAASHFTRMIAVEYASLGIRANVISAGLVETPRIHVNLANAYNVKEDYLEKRHAQVPLGFMGNAWDVAHTAVFLASDFARYITGADIVVDGGLTMTTRN